MEKKKRNTKTKQLVMSVLEKANAALCHEDIEKQLSGQLDRVTIYRILQGFCDDGILHKITSESGKSHYALCHNCSLEKHNDEHLHFHCICCDNIFCLEAPLVIAPLPAGYEARAVSCLISGYCRDCSGASRG
ncbi:MAG: transcriptional repressor [Dysgonamonadaceae bacterium]|jgi:Fe2+ or Zn2+ uptake regulation protein|nr:transcriptional repressor [Dysgonamonadaceae bacterium]